MSIRCEGSQARQFVLACRVFTSSRSAMRQFTAILLDVDGTLIDSNDAHAQSWCHALAEFDRPVEFKRIRRLIGKGGDKLLAETVGLSDVEGVGKLISKRREERFVRDQVARLKRVPQSPLVDSGSRKNMTIGTPAGP
jgi:phosphoglycolate phosphatase-like HAD superfamily hydrolase